MKTFVLSVLAIVLIVEEWLWDLLTALGGWLARLLGLARFEAWLSQTSPTVALLTFAIPVLIVTPINIAALWLLAHGLLLQALLLELVAKLLGTLMITRVFALTKPQLLSFAAIHWVYNTIMRWLRWAHERLVQTAAYRLAKQTKARVSARIKIWLQPKTGGNPT